MEVIMRIVMVILIILIIISVGKIEDFGGNIDEYFRFDKGRSSIVKLDSGIVWRSLMEGLFEIFVDDSVVWDSDIVFFGEEFLVSCIMYGEVFSSVLLKENVNRLDSMKYNVMSLFGLFVVFGVVDDSV